MKRKIQIIFGILLVGIIGTFLFLENGKRKTVVLVVPENVESYSQKMTEFVQMGGVDPLPSTPFVKKEARIKNYDQRFQEAVNLVTQEIPLFGGTRYATVATFGLREKTAYIQLDIDIDGWAGVSVAIAKIHPLVERTLREFPEIDQIVFGPVPEQ